MYRLKAFSSGEGGFAVRQRRMRRIILVPTYPFSSSTASGPPSPLEKAILERKFFMEIKASSIYDKKTIMALTRQSLSQKKPLFIIIFALLGLINIVNLYGFLTSEYYSLSTFIFTLAVTIFLVLYIFIFLPRLNYKLHKTTTDAINKYVFYDTKLGITSTAQGITGTTEVEYSSLYHAYETKEYLFLYIAKAKAMIVDKSTIEDNGIEQIRTAITSQIGADKYKIKI